MTRLPSHFFLTLVPGSNALRATLPGSPSIHAVQPVVEKLFVQGSSVSQNSPHLPPGLKMVMCYFDWQEIAKRLPRGQSSLSRQHWTHTFSRAFVSVTTECQSLVMICRYYTTLSIVNSPSVPLFSCFCFVYTYDNKLLPRLDSLASSRKDQHQGFTNLMFFQCAWNLILEPSFCNVVCWFLAVPVFSLVTNSKFQGSSRRVKNGATKGPVLQVLERTEPMTLIY